MSLPLFYKPSKTIHKNLDNVIYSQTYYNQNFVLSFMHPNTPYRGLLLTFQLGNGKTYVASALTHLYNTNGYSVLFLAHNLSTIENFKKEYNTFINDNQVSNDTMNIKYMGITKFLSSNYNIDNHLIIIDEAHNIRENANRYHKLYNILNSNNTIRILLITATPMIDNIKEIDSLRNLIEPNAPIAYSDTITNADNIIGIDNNVVVDKTFVGEKMDIGTLFISKFKGKQLDEYKSLISTSHKDIYTKIRQTSLSVDNIYNKNIPLDEQSAKINVLINSLIDGELTVVFSFYVKRGIYFLKDVLDNLGWEEYNNNNDNDNDNTKTKKYAILDGKTPLITSSNIIDTFNSITNSKGENISLLIGSSVMNESISLRNIKHVHILTPFWNYGQIRQAIGRTIRMRSHDYNTKVKIYLHATILHNYNSIDIDMYSIAFNKDKLINDQLNYIKSENICPNTYTKPISIHFPSVDNKLIIEYKDYILDCRRCFDTNISKISWYNVYPDNLVIYNKNTNTIQYGVTEFIYFPKPEEGTITGWKSIVDGRIRITDLRILISNKRKMKRGKLIINMNDKELASIAYYLNCSKNIETILNTLKSKDKFIESQIILE